MASRRTRSLGRRLVAVALVLAAGFSFWRAGGCATPAGRSPRPPRPATSGGETPGGSSRGERRSSPAPTPAPARELAGEVVRIRDGDSLVVLVDRAPVEVRLDGVDAPELAQDFGSRAKRCTSELAFGRSVRLEARGKDKYERTLAEVFLPDGRSLNRELVVAGCAWWFRRYSTDADYEAREREARAARRGLWADPNPVPPWEWRESRRSGQDGRQ